MWQGWRDWWQRIGRRGRLLREQIWLAQETNRLLRELIQAQTGRAAISARAGQERGPADLPPTGLAWHRQTGIPLPGAASSLPSDGKPSAKPR